MNASFYFPNLINSQSRKNSIFYPALKMSKDYPKTENPNVQPDPKKKETSTGSTANDGTDTPKQRVKRTPRR